MLHTNSEVVDHSLDGLNITKMNLSPDINFQLLQFFVDNDTL